MDEQEKKSTLTELNPPPDYIAHRQKIWEELRIKHQNYLASQPQVDISITLPDGKTLPGKSWKTTPLEIAHGISQSLASETVIAKVNGELWDLDRPFEKSSSLQLIKFDDEEGKQVFWHSTAHIMGEAMELCYGGCLCYGPPIEQGFYYDMYMDNKTVSGLDFEVLEKVMKTAIKEEQPFERLEISKEDLMRLFGYNQFKVRILNEKVNTPTTTVYKCGPLIDLCRGPHIRHTGKVKAFAITKNSSSYWEGDNTREALQRIYGISFPNPKQLKEWLYLQEEATKRNHRKIGLSQELFFFHELSPGSCFFYPKGVHIYNKLVEYIREEYRKRGYQEVITPNIFNSKLWKQSGHWDHYADNMFKIEIEKETFALKPMNCPGHCLTFASRLRSWRELPLRLADFGVLHRNELSGALSGLTRVRRFQQDDAHIFCAQSQIKSEIQGCLEFLKSTYSIFDFSFELKLSTRPESFLGEIETWNEAESQLEEALNSFGYAWKLNPGDGAFYGPKIDITIRDALQRAYQCATIQLDFQLPQRFQLQYQTDEQGELKTPVIIHRAMLGSIERMFAILTESFGGKWPFWLSPRQMVILPVFPLLDDYCNEVQKKFWEAGFQVECDLDAGTTLNKKIRSNQLAQFNFIGVIGQQEQTNGTINIRTRDNKQHGEFPIDEVIRRFAKLAASRTNHAEDEFGDGEVAGVMSRLAATTVSDHENESDTTGENKVPAARNQSNVQREKTVKGAQSTASAVPSGDQQQTKDKKEKQKKTNKEETATANTAIDITRFDLRVGKILSVKKHPDAESLYVEEIDVGEEKPRTVCSGLLKFMQPSDLDQKLVIVLCNLKPAKMRGITSEAMVMCASTPEKVELVEPSVDCKPGDRVECDGYDCSSPDAQIKKELSDQILPDIRTNENGEATYKGVLWRVGNGKGVIKAATLVNVPIK